MFIRQFNVMFKKYSNLKKKSKKKRNFHTTIRKKKLYIKSKNFYENFKTKKNKMFKQLLILKTIMLYS